MLESRINVRAAYLIVIKLPSNRILFPEPVKIITTLLNAMIGKSSQICIILFDIIDLPDDPVQ